MGEDDTTVAETEFQAVAKTGGNESLAKAEFVEDKLVSEAGTLAEARHQAEDRSQAEAKVEAEIQPLAEAEHGDTPSLPVGIPRQDSRTNLFKVGEIDTPLDSRVAEQATIPIEPAELARIEDKKAEAEKDEDLQLIPESIQKEHPEGEAEDTAEPEKEDHTAEPEPELFPTPTPPCSAYQPSSTSSTVDMDDEVDTTDTADMIDADPTKTASPNSTSAFSTPTRVPDFGQQPCNLHFGSRHLKFDFGRRTIRFDVQGTTSMPVPEPGARLQPSLPDPARRSLFDVRLLILYDRLRSSPRADPDANPQHAPVDVCTDAEPDQVHADPILFICTL